MTIIKCRVNQFQWEILLLCLLPIVAGCPSKTTSNLSVVYPSQEWQTISPVKAGFDPAKWNAWIAGQTPKGTNWGGERHLQNEWSVVLVRAGYLVRTWGNPEYRYQVASVSKAFLKLLLQLTIDEGLIASDEDLVVQYWTGENELSDPHKYLNKGNHRNLTFRHLWQHRGGFPVSNGYDWKKRKDVPKWAKWTGNPDYDNYAHVVPGSARKYSSGGYWRLTQALTVIWRKSLEQVLDEKVFSKIGIPADRWGCLSGKHVHDTADFYPDMPGYGTFVDPPYYINGHIPVTCKWIEINAKDLARIGLLIASRGVWEGERLVNDSELLGGHLGGNDSELKIQNCNEQTVWVRVTTTGINFPHGVFNKGIRHQEC